jgi:hypothetical protein
MAVIVLLSTMSFTVEKHYCGDFLVDVSFIGNVEKCAVDSGEASAVKMKDCCSDEVDHIEGQDELQKENHQQLTVEQQYILLSFSVDSVVCCLDSRDSKDLTSTSPPKLHQNLQIFYQTFLI